ncbi:MAG: hypothetical protein GXP36_09940 [Actinobacteria bacterium]|nr:hypothetical protein [Actinomycetota bacterium]
MTNLGPAVLAVLREYGEMQFDTLCSHLGVQGLTAQGDLIHVLRGLHNQGLITTDTADFGEWESDATIGLSPSVGDLAQVLGLSIIELVERQTGKSATFTPFFGRPVDLPKAKVAELFVLMPFRDELTPVYDNHLKKVADRLDLSMKRADDFFTTHDIMKDIWDGICNAKVVIADCTDRNPNVFYEIGIAHTVGKPVVLITQDSNDVPFDLRHVRYIQYQYTPPGMERFEKALKETIQATLGAQQ